MDLNRGWGPELNILRGWSQVSDLYVHLVFLTKCRRGGPTAKILACYKEIMIDVCFDFGATLFEFNGETGPRPPARQVPTGDANLTLRLTPKRRVHSLPLRKLQGHLRRYFLGWTPVVIFLLRQIDR